MKHRLKLFAAFAAGVLLTVSAYEVTRLVVNARQALYAASIVVADPEPEPPSVEALAEEAVPIRRRKGPDRVLPPGERRKKVDLEALQAAKQAEAEAHERAMRIQRRKRRLRNQGGLPTVTGSLSQRVDGIPAVPAIPGQDEEPLSVDTGKPE